MYQSVDLYYEPRQAMSSKIAFFEGEPEMSEFESAFLCGMIRRFSPHKLVEIGIAGGGTTAIIMQCMDLLKVPCEIHSVDIVDTFDHGPLRGKKTGFLADEAKQFIGNSVRQKTYRGKIAPEFMPEIKGDIDFAIIDTVHTMPGEILDFIALMPYLKDEAVVVLHDIANNYGKDSMSTFRKHANVTKVLFDSVYADKYFMKDPQRDDRKGFPNIAGFQINAETRKHLNNAVSALSSTWYHLPPEDQLAAYSKAIEAAIDDEGKWLYQAAVSMNIDISRAPYKFKDKVIACGKIMLNR